MEITWKVISGDGEGKNGGKCTGNKKHNWQVQNRQGEVKNSIGNGEAKELMCVTHGHELREDCWKEWGNWMEESKGEKWLNCNSIINKIYFLKRVIEIKLLLQKWLRI